jgi:hypothetical protein
MTKERTEIILNLISDLEGTCTDLSVALKEYNLTEEDLTMEDRGLIDENIFLCETCGWWYGCEDCKHDEVCYDCSEDEDE